MMRVNPAIIVMVSGVIVVDGADRCQKQNGPIQEFFHLFLRQGIGIEVRVYDRLTTEVFAELLHSTGRDETRWSVNDDAHPKMRPDTAKGFLMPWTFGISTTCESSGPLPTHATVGGFQFSGPGDSMAKMIFSSSSKLQ